MSGFGTPLAGSFMPGAGGVGAIGGPLGAAIPYIGPALALAPFVIEGLSKLFNRGNVPPEVAFRRYKDASGSFRAPDDIWGAADRGKNKGSGMARLIESEYRRWYAGSGGRGSRDMYDPYAISGSFYGAGGTPFPYGVPAGYTGSGPQAGGQTKQWYTPRNLMGAEFLTPLLASNLAQRREMQMAAEQPQLAVKRPSAPRRR